MDRAIETVADVIDAAAGGRAVLVGLSLGGYVSAVVAARAPEKVRGLVLAGASAGTGWPASIGLLALATAFEVGGRPLERLSRWYVTRRFPPAIAGPIVRGGFWPVGGAAALRALTHVDLGALLAAYPGDTRIVNGAWDPWFRAGAPAMARAAATRGRVRRIRIAQATHLSNLDQPAAFNLAVRRFMTDLGER